jgi:epoxyqueuosine reductase
VEKLIKLLLSVGTADAAALSISECKIINPRLLSRLDFEPQSVIMGIMPYYTAHCDGERIVSAYAVAPDYHLAQKKLAEKFLAEARKLYPHRRFALYGDHSPIAEVDAAARAGLGIIGKHGLLITPKYSSFVFIFGVFSDIPIEPTRREVRYCEGCGACVRACPTRLKNGGECLSAVTQKKGALTDEEQALMLKHGTAWGCDICQNVCPHTIRAKKEGTLYTDSEWFNSRTIPVPDKSVVDSDGFAERAYSWRGKDVFLRNLTLFEKKSKN